MIIESILITNKCNKNDDIPEININTSEYKINYVPQGWQCPICKTIYSPNIFSCSNCQPKVDEPYKSPPEYPFYPNYPISPVWLNDPLQPCNLPSFTCIVSKPNDTPDLVKPNDPSDWNGTV